MTAFLRIITAAAAGLLIASAAWAESIDSVDKAGNTALLNNLDYKSALLEVRKAENALESIFRIEKSSLGISGSYGNRSSTGTDAADSDTESTYLFGWQASANLPLFEQLTVGASVDQDLTGTFSLNFSPLSHSASVEQSRLNYSLAVAAAEQKASEVADAAVESYLKWAAASTGYDIKVRTAEVKRSLYEDERIRFDRGESDLDSVRDAFTAWSEARTAMNTGLTSLQELETDLYAVLNLDPEEADLAAPDTDELNGLIARIEERLGESDPTINNSYTVMSASAAVENYRLELDSTWLFEPDLSIAGSMSISPDSAVPTFSATASLSISPENWNSDERSELETQLEISMQQEAQVRNAERLKISQLKIAAENAGINLGVAGIEKEQADELLSEAEFLYQQGEYSEAELEETRLQSLQSANGLFSATADRYTSLRALSAYTDSNED